MKKQKHQNFYYDDEEELVNIFEIKTGSIAEKMLYRSGIPFYRSGIPLRKDKEANPISTMVKEIGINCVINLENNCSNIDKLSENIPWYNNHVKKNKVICLPMSFIIPGDYSNEQKLKTALNFMIGNNGPYLIHCYMGVDRTGFFIAILEALMGASLKDICFNYTHAFPFDYIEPHLRDFINVHNLFTQFKTMFHGNKITNRNIQKATESYLVKIGFNSEKIELLRKRLSDGTIY